MGGAALSAATKTRYALLPAIVVSMLQAAPLRLHPKNPHYFLFRGNAVALITSGEHYGAVLNADFNYRRYLSTLQSDGLNYTRVFGGSYVEQPAKSFGILRNDLAPLPERFVAPWARSQTPGYAGGGNKFDLKQWNPEYFQRFHDFLSDAAKLGIVVEITLFSSQYDEKQWNLSPFKGANNVNGTDEINWKKVNTLENGNILAIQEQYARKLVREANAFDNVTFEIQNEPWSDRPVKADVVNPYLFGPGRDKYPNTIDLADDRSMHWQTRVAEWITTEEASLPNKHLIAQNYSNFGFPVRQLAPNVSIVNFHYAYPGAVLWNYGLGKAISYDESGFLGREDRVYLRQAWNFMLSGGSVFDNLDYSFSVGHEDGGDMQPNGPGGGSPALRGQLRILSEFLHKLSLVDLAPDTHTVTHATGAYTHMLSNPGRQYALYVDGTGTVDVVMDLPAGEYSGNWMNVKTGKTEKRERFRHDGGEKTLKTPRFEDGFALRLDVDTR
jgi:hypothetical protein